MAKLIRQVLVLVEQFMVLFFVEKDFKWREEIIIAFVT